MNVKKNLFLLLVFIISLLFSSCENFLTGNTFKEKLEAEVNYTNAPDVTVLVTADPNTGNTVPAGNYQVKAGYAFDISFDENTDDYQFLNWAAYKDNKIVTDGVTFESPKSVKTNVTVANIDGITIKAECAKRIKTTNNLSPQYSPNGVSRDRSIVVEFTKKLSSNCFIFAEDEVPEDAVPVAGSDGQIWAYKLNNQTFFKNVSITNTDGISLAEHFLQPVVEGALLTVATDKTNPITIDVGSTYKTITVILGSDICDESGIKMGTDKEWRYQVTEATDEQATIALTSNSTEGNIYLPGTRDYSIGQKISLIFTENPDYQFIRWDYDSSIVYIEDNKNISAIATVISKTENNAVSEIKAVCAPRLRTIDSEFMPKAEGNQKTVGKNSTIVIQFNKDLPVDEEGLEQINNISITTGGTDIRNCFIYPPTVVDNTITFVADRTNMLDIPKGQTKTVTVKVPADFYYVNSDGTKVTYGAAGKTYTYVADHTTVNKADITFVAAAGSGSFVTESGTQYYSLNEISDLEFSLADGYVFDGWEITSSDPEFDAVNIIIDDPDSLKTKLRVYEAYGGITVKAKCHKIAKAAISPDYTSLGVACDTPITISFDGIEINQSTVNLAEKGSVQIVNPENESVHFENYYTLEWENKNIVLKPISDYSIKALVPAKEDVQNIKIILDSKVIERADGFHLEGDNSFIYRINGSTEEIQPDVSMSIYRPLYESGIEKAERVELSKEGRTQIQDDEVLRKTNHINNKIFINCNAADSGSGVKELVVEETLLKYVTDSSDLSSSVTLKSEPYAYSQFNSAMTYTLRSEHDGVVKLDFVVSDYAGNKTVNTYYVHKDTSFDASKIMAGSLIPDNRNKVLLSELTSQLSFELTPDTVKDYYFGNELSDIYAEAYWGLSSSTINNQMEYDALNKRYVLTNAARRTKDSTLEKDVYVKFSVLDEVGNKAEVVRIIPGNTSIVSVTSKQSGSYYGAFIRPIGLGEKKAMLVSMEAVGTDYYILYRTKDNEGSSWSDYSVAPRSLSDSGNYVNNALQVETTKKYYEISLLPYFEYAERFYWGTACEPVVVTVGEDGVEDYLTRDTGIVVPQSLAIELVGTADDYAPNSGYVKIKATPKFTEAKSENCKYYIYYYSTPEYTSDEYIERMKSYLPIEGDSISFSIDPGIEYFYGIYAVNEEAGIYQMKNLATQSSLESFDKNPPYINFSSYYPMNTYTIQFSTNGYYLVKKYAGRTVWPQDYGFGLYKNAEGKIEFDYYLIKNDVNPAPGDIEPLDIKLSDLEKYKTYKKTLSYDENADYIFIPYGAIEQGIYTLCIHLKDNSGNDSVTNLSCRNIVVEEKTEPGFKKLVAKLTSDATETVAALELIDKTNLGYSQLVMDKKEWYATRPFMNTYLGNHTKYSLYFENSAKSSEYVNCDFDSFYKIVKVNSSKYGFNLPYFFLPKYVYQKDTDDELECVNKNIISSQKSFQIYYDNPMFVHTMCCPEELDEDNPALWEARGYEVSIETKSDCYNYKKTEKGTASKTFTYIPDLSKVEKGWKYVVIAHFADGTTIMSDIKTVK